MKKISPSECDTTLPRIMVGSNKTRPLKGDKKKNQVEAVVIRVGVSRVN